MSEREQRCIQMRCGDSIVRGMYLDELLALRAKVERLEGEKLRLREVVKSVEHSERVNPLNGQRYNSCPSCWQAEPQHFTDCQLAAVLRETEVE